MNKIFFISLIFLTNINISYSQEKSRSAKTGRYVTADYASKNKSTTYTSKIKK